MNNKTVSVLLTSYNQGQWLRESIESVLAQTMPEWELILLDNGSTDESPTIIEEYRRHPKVVTIRYERNLPLTIICNDAIRRAKGRYFSLLHSDDYYLPQKLEQQVAAFEMLPPEYGVVYSTGYRLMSDGEMRLVPCGTFRGNIMKPLLTEPQFFLPIAPLVRMECLHRYPFNETIFWEGEGIYAKIAMCYWFHPLPEPLVVMRDHPNNMGKEIASNLKRNVLMYEALFAHPDFPPDLHFLRAQALGGTYRIGGWEAIRRERNYRQGGDWLRMAIRCNPQLARNPRVLVGLVLSALPTSCADFGNHLLNLAMGAPAPPVQAPPTPVEASKRVGHSRSGTASLHSGHL